MKNLILAIICLLCFTSCHYFYFMLIDGKKRKAKDFASIRYDTVPINISKIIRTDGFFTEKDINHLVIKPDSVINDNIIFYDDGRMPFSGIGFVAVFLWKEIDKNFYSKGYVTVHFQKAFSIQVILLFLND